MSRYPALFLFLLPLLLAAPATAQIPLLQVDYQNNPVFHVRSDGTLYLPIGAAAGYVLTTDATGNATWMPASSGGLTLPFAGTTTSSSPAFSVENTGAGRGLESTTKGVALWASSAVSEGLRVSSAGTRGVFVVSSSQEAFGAQFVGGDGVSIFRAGSPTTTLDSPFNNGFEVDGTSGFGLFVGRADLSGVRVESTGGNGLSVGSASADGVSVSSAGGDGVFVGSAGEDGVRVFSAGTPTMAPNGSAFFNGFEVAGAEGHGLFVGRADESGVHVTSAGDDGVRVESAGNPSATNSSTLNNGFEIAGAEGHGLYVGHANQSGVWVESAGDYGVRVESAGQDGVRVGSVGSPTTTNGSTFKNGFEVEGAEGLGLYVGHADLAGVFVSSAGLDGLNVLSAGRYGVFVTNAGDQAGFFTGDVTVTGTLTKGSGTFKIDHPLDPENRYLSHSFVESPDMMNVYNGNITTDAEGFARVHLPDYFEALNRDFRYQLTVIGTFSQAIVAEKIQDSRFVIQTDQPNVEVSWQVTGIRQDPYAEQNRVVVEEDKPLEEQGYYLHPEAYGQPKERGIGHLESLAHRPDEGQR